MPEIKISISTRGTPTGVSFLAFGTIGEICVQGEAQVSNEVPPGLHHYVATDLARHIAARLQRGHRLLARLRSR